jgi:hypothetical protein
MRVPLGDACCLDCTRRLPSSGGPHGGLGDVAVDLPQTLDQRVADIQARAKQYVEQDLFYRRVQVLATLAIPFAAVVTKAILHLRKGIPIL